MLLQAFHFWQWKSQEEHVLLDLPVPLRAGAYAFLVGSVFIVGFRYSPFIYFQF